MKSHLIILASGKISEDFKAIYHKAASMMPFNGRPLIYQAILDFMQQSPDGCVYVVLRQNDYKTADFLKTAFLGRVKLSIMFVSDGFIDSEASCLNTVLEKMAHDSVEDAPTIVLQEGYYLELSDLTDFLRQDNCVVGLLGNHGDSPAVCGVWVHYSWKFLHALLQAKICLNSLSIEGLLQEYYGDKLTFSNIPSIVNLGQIDSAVKISSKVLGSRTFNSIQIDEKRGLITKSSEKDFKILQEINYYLKLPRHLKIYFPRLFDYKLGKSISYTIEYYPYKTLSQFFVMYSMPLGVWEQIFDKLFDIYSDFTKITYGEPTPESVEKIYLEKIYDRFAQLEANKELSALVNLDSVVINGKAYAGWKSYLPWIEEIVDNISQDSKRSVIHGDLCFSNILYEPSTGIMRLIDPRGEFYEEGVHGDSRYDMAKLLHSVHGNYDFVIHKMYVLIKNAADNYDFNLIKSENVKAIKSLFLAKLEKVFSKKAIRELLVLEALLFLTMLPLHSDDTDRQKAFYLIALNVLDEAKNLQI